MFPIVAPGHVPIARSATRSLATALGFDRRAAAELTIVASELATNIIKYGIRGQLTISGVHDEERGPGLRIVAEDCGPPLYNLSWALLDGCDDQGPIDPHKLYGRRGLGTGLGAVVRLTDGLEYVEAPPLKRLQVVRYLARDPWGQRGSLASSGGRRGPQHR